MGLERLAAVIQGVTSNYDSDLFTGIIRFIEKISGRTYGQNAENDISIRVIADHSRAVTFLIGDGVLPSNEGRGYVLRRILRRAARHGKLLGMNRPFLHEVAGVVIDEMKGAYPDLVEHGRLYPEGRGERGGAFHRDPRRGTQDPPGGGGGPEGDRRVDHPR